MWRDIQYSDKNSDRKAKGLLAKSEHIIKM